MNPDGTDWIRLTHSQGSDRNPSWSPDGKKIAFAGRRDDHFTNIYINNTDGSNEIRVTNDECNYDDPDFAPDGEMIAFTSWCGGSMAIYKMNLDGTNLVKLTSDENVGRDYNPVWSPDGKKIAYFSDRNYEDAESGFQIYIMNPDGGDQIRLTDCEYGCMSPSWSPNGKMIAYAKGVKIASQEYPIMEIFIMNADGSNQAQITDSEALNNDPSWSPDGKKIVFMSDRDCDSSRPECLEHTDSRFDIYVMNIDGSDPIRLTSSANGHGIYPAWSP